MVNTSCAVSSCRSKSQRSKGIKFHQFPKDRSQLWIKACRRPDLLDKDAEQLRHMHICSLHFEPRMYAKQLLKKSAVPTLNLPTTCTATASTQTEECLPDDWHSNMLQISTSQGVQTDPIDVSEILPGSASGYSQKMYKREHVSDSACIETGSIAYNAEGGSPEKDAVRRATCEVTTEHFLELCDVFLPYSLSAFVKESLR